MRKLVTAKRFFIERRKQLFALLVLCLMARSASISVPHYAASKDPRATGVYHVHSSRSHDSALTDPAIAKQANSLGHQFIILTDHNAQDETKMTIRDHTLMISAMELSSDFGHVVALDADSRLKTDPMRAQEPFAAIERAHGFSIVAHPTCPKRPFTASHTGAGGIEIANVGSTARRFWRHPLDLFEGLIAVVRPSRARFLMNFYRHDEDAILAWDQGPIDLIGFCASDAHGRADLRGNLMTWHLVLDIPEAPALSSALITHALSAGRFYCAAGAFGRNPGLSFFGTRKDGGLFHSGEEQDVRKVASLSVTVPEQGGSPGQLRLLKDGVEIAKSETTTLVVEDLTPGIYRAEYALYVPRVLGARALRPVAYTQKLKLGAP